MSIAVLASRSKSADAKTRLIAATSALMVEKDSVEVTLSEIAKHSGMNSALVKYHFGNKEGLLFALLERDISGSVTLLERLLERHELDPVEKMQLHLSGLVEAYARLPYLDRLIQLLVREAGEERVKMISKDFIQRIARGQKKLLEEGVTKGHFKKIDPVSFYFTVTGAASCLYSKRFVMKAAFDLDAVDQEAHRQNVLQVANLLLYDLCKEPPTSASKN